MQFWSEPKRSCRLSSRGVCDKAAGRRKKALSLGHCFARVDARCGGENAAGMPELMLRDRGEHPLQPPSMLGSAD
jgi:hypothetical protein